MPLKTAPPLQVGVAIALAFLAGCVDAIGFAMLGGLFVSFMSGNSTRMGVFAAQGDEGKVIQIAGIIAAFVAGACFGSILARTTGRWRQGVILAAEAVILALAALTSSHGHGGVGTGLMAAAMGLENATFVDERGETKINLTFMTGALVKVGEGLAAASLGGPRWSWLPYLLMWLGLTAGAACGTLGYGAFGVATLYGVSFALIVLAAGLGGYDHGDVALIKG